MNAFRVLGFAVAAACCFVSRAQAQIVANSINDFSTTTQGANNWYYGFFNRGSDTGNPIAYTTGGFVQFGIYSTVNSRWQVDTANSSQVTAVGGSQNATFLNINSSGGHPAGIGPGSQNSVVWAVRRYVVPADGMYEISYDFKKQNTSGGNGATAYLLIDGTVVNEGASVFPTSIAFNNNTGVQGTFTRTLTTGTFIDFAIDPKGTTINPVSDNLYSARSDGSTFSAIITQVPEPAALFPVALGLLGFGMIKRWHAGRLRTRSTRL